MSATRQEWFTLALLGLLLAALIWSGLRLREKRAAARDAADNLAECRKLAAEIAGSQESPVIAAMASEPGPEITLRIETAAEAASLPPRAVTSIDPQPPQRIGQTPYRLHDTRVELSPLSLPQVVVFLEAVVAGEESMTVSTLRLTAPRRGSTGDAESWRTEVGLTQLVYDPITPAPE